MKAISVAVVTFALGCGGGGGPIPGDDTTPPGDALVTPEPDANLACSATRVTDVGGKITANVTWSDTINITSQVIINPGVTVTVLAGTTIKGNTGIGLSVLGTLDIQGTKQCTVTARGAMPGAFWSGIAISSGGTLTASYLVQTGGGIHLKGTAHATITDTAMSRTGGDFLTMDGGVLDASYSAIGLEPGEVDTTHCDMHMGGTNGNTIKVTHSNISTAKYGMMFYQGVGADLTYNNWFSNAIDIDTEIANPVTGDVSFGFFEKGAPAKAGITANNLASARLSDAGPR